MYLPILRGKQYELLALREFSKEPHAREVISPIIEPVLDEFKGLETACEYLSDSKFNFIIVVNPAVGKIKNPEHVLQFILRSACLKSNSNFQLGVHSYNEEQLNFVLGLIVQNGLQNQEIVLIHNDVIQQDFYEMVSSRFTIKYNFLGERIKSRRFKQIFPINTRVILEDAFVPQQKNADYVKNVDEPFSDVYLVYRDENYAGFSDYLTIGEQFTDGGFIPYAVVIHLTYEKDESIRIRHFVSDSNDDYHDTPGKFGEALEKLVHFTSTLTFKTKAVKTFEDYYKRSHYPGLGTIKKLSMLNHLELINHLLEAK